MTFHDSFIEVISTSDLDLKDKLKVLEYAADEAWLQNKNLNYLEIRYIIKELKQC